MTADHVLNALKEIEFESMIPELESALTGYRKIMADKKNRKSLNSEAATGKATEEEVDDEMEVIDD